MIPPVYGFLGAKKASTGHRKPFSKLDHDTRNCMYLFDMLFMDDIPIQHMTTTSQKLKVLLCSLLTFFWRGNND